MNQKLYEIIARVMEVPVSQINDESSPETIDNWDSFNGLVLVDKLEEAYNIKFEIAEIVGTNSVKDIKKGLSNHGISFDD